VFATHHACCEGIKDVGSWAKSATKEMQQLEVAASLKVHLTA
jgi:hypothetical protein